MDFKCGRIQWQTLLSQNTFVMTSEVRVLGAHSLVDKSCSLETTKNELRTTNTTHLPFIKFGGSAFCFAFHLPAKYLGNYHL